MPAWLTVTVSSLELSGWTSEPELVFQTYGRSNLLDERDAPSTTGNPGEIPSHVRMITMAPERPGALDTIRWLSEEGLVLSIGHMAANYDQAQAAIQVGAAMITHLFNQMNGHHHREPGPLGILGGAGETARRVVLLILGSLPMGITSIRLVCVLRIVFTPTVWSW